MLKNNQVFPMYVFIDITTKHVVGHILPIKH